MLVIDCLLHVVPHVSCCSADMETELFFFFFYKYFAYKGQFHELGRFAAFKFVQVVFEVKMTFVYFS